MGRLATDIGGTFTDLVYFDEETGALSVAKSLSTPDDLTRGVLDTIDQAQLDADAVDYFVHGGTTVINAITERTGAKTALVTTEGFRDVLEIARGNRPDLYNLRYRKEVPFVPRRLRFEVRERVDAKGRIRVPLHLEDLDRVVEACRSQGVEAIAIQFLHSYAAPAHEEETAAYLRERLNGVAITASHEITREWREYERANTAVLNAYVQPIVQRYFDTLEAGIDGLGLDCPMMAMQSNGGTTSFGWAREHPITLLESGPAAGVNGAALIGRLCDEPDVIYLDIGGTTAKCSTIEGGEPKVTTDYRLEATRIRYGYPVRGAGDRHRGDRRGRRLHRLVRRGRHALRGSPKRRRRSGARLLRPRRNRAHRDRRQAHHRRVEPGEFCRRAVLPRYRTGTDCHGQDCRRVGLQRRRGGGCRDSPGRCQHDQRAQAGLDPARPRSQ